jgi:hypothetical protein
LLHKGSESATSRVTRLRRQLKEKYFDYSPDCADNSEKTTSTTSSSTSLIRRQLRLATLGGSSSPRTRANYRQRSGARHQLAPECEKITLKIYDFIDISNMVIPTALGGSTTTLPPIVIVILRQQLAYLYIINYAVPTTPHPIKAKFSSSKSRLLLSPHPTLGGSAMNNHPAYH